MGFVKPDAPEECDSTAPEVPSSHASSWNFCIAHLSDLHLFDPRNMRPKDYFSKRILGYLSWQLHRQSEHKLDFVPALAEALDTARVDHVAITGDLTHLGHDADFKTAARIIKQLGGPERISLIPGNHDAYIANPWRQDTFGLAPYYRSDPSPQNAEPSPNPQDLLESWPMMRERGGIALIGVSSACPTRPFLATGAIGRQQMNALESMLIRTAEKGMFRLILIHHPPVRGLVSSRKQLTDQESFAGIIRRTGAELILHGHTHRFGEAAMDGPHGKVPVFGVPSLTALSGIKERRAGFRLYRIRTAGNGWEIEVSVYRYSISRAAFLPAGSRTLAVPIEKK